MENVVKFPDQESRVSPRMLAFIEKNGYGLHDAGGNLYVTGEEDGDPFELGYDLFCAITEAHYGTKLG